MKIRRSDTELIPEKRRGSAPKAHGARFPVDDAVEALAFPVHFRFVGICPFHLNSAVRAPSLESGRLEFPVVNQVTSHAFARRGFHKTLPVLEAVESGGFIGDWD